MTAELAVIRISDQWSLQAPEGERGRFASRQDAQEAACQFLVAELAAGRDCVILVQDGRGQLRLADR